MKRKFNCVGDKLSQMLMILGLVLDLLQGKAFATETTKQKVWVIPEESGRQGESERKGVGEGRGLSSIYVFALGPVIRLRMSGSS